MFQKSKIPKIQNPQNPKSPQSKIQNPQNPKSKIPKIQNPSFFGRILGILDFGDFGFGIPAPKSKIQTPQNPKSKIPKIQNPQNPKSPKSKILRQNPKFGALGASRKELLHNDPKSKIQNPQNPAKKVWILDFGDFGDFGFWGFWDFGDFGFWGFWILDFGILDFGDFGFWDFGDFGFWGFWILGFLGGPGDVPLGNLVTVPGGQRLESPLVCLWGPLQNQLYRIELGQGSKLNIFSEVRTLQNQKNPDFQPRGQNFTKSQKNPDFQPRGQNPTKSQKKPRLPTQRSELYKITEKPRLCGLPGSAATGASLF